ncbi:hypothetical protein PRIPAC_71872 [Pristionchus pacificus]|uniref:Uncharacterized protein n=1 Tax=Pristionchus pacificus TaxID=54126 RepID=A0A2A6CGL0_PRIPA|nr:hypothetical protein PRIPAC_71872 [Pristionchus pacificus]|eukprot:PDM77227.1 hypothetical protein PRIPAC_43139 [Pristionchus pacificus]
MTDRVEEARLRLAASKAQAAAAQTQQAPVHQTQMVNFNDSLPTGAEAVNFLGSVRDTHPRLSRRLFEESDKHPSSSSPQLPQIPAGLTLLADRFAERLTPCFNEVAEGLDALHSTKAAVTQWENHFGDASYKEKEAHVGNLSLQDARDLLCAELQNSEQLEKKLARYTKRCDDLEKKVRNAETYAMKVYDVYYKKTADEVHSLLGEVRAKEIELLVRVEKAEGERRKLMDQMEEVKENLRLTSKREEAVRKELEEVTAAYRNAVGQQQKAAAVVETTRGENARLEQQVRSLQQQLTDVTERERESRTESARLADTARGARESEERRVAEVTREANRRLNENERKANADLERIRAEMAAEYHQLQTKARKLADDLRKENETVERYADRVRRSEAKVVEWQQRFDQRIEEERAELQKQIASSYRGIMSDIAPRRRIMTGDEENATSYPLFSSRRRDPSPAPIDQARPSSLGPPMAPTDDNRKRQLRNIIATSLPPPRR